MHLKQLSSQKVFAIFILKVPSISLLVACSCLYGLYRALAKPGMSVVLTIISLGTRVALAYALSAIPSIGVVGIWWSVPIGWFLADALGVIYYILKVNNKDFTATT